MKVNTNTLEVTRSGTFAEQSFGIANTAQAFDILSSKIYTRIPEAIVRELSTNASDSHTDAGCPERQFDVHLPNSLEPWLTIRDYGTGLSPENVETIYTTYFRSTRSTSNDFTGCLGLGSKSPFAYTDQFTIVSNWNGRKYTYSAFKNESGCPALALLGQCETDESNGLEIRIDIKPYDSMSFVNAAQQVYTFFKVRPNITGAKIDFSTFEPLLEQDGVFALYENKLQHKINVVMGQVCYTVNEHEFTHKLGSYGQIVLHMPMGSCEIAASREEIHYSASTRANITKALNTAFEYATAQFETMVKDEPSALQKMRKLNKYKNIIYGLSIKGVTSIQAYETDKYTLKEASSRRGDKIYINQFYSEFRYGGHVDQYVFIEDDVEITQNIKNRLRAYMRGKDTSRFLLAKIQDRARFTELFGEVDTKLSLLPDVPKVARIKTTREEARSKPIKLLKEDKFRNMGYEWENVTDDATVDATDACCVVRDGVWVKWNGRTVKPNEVRKIAVTLGFKRVYGISEKRYASLQAKFKLVELEKVAKDRTATLVAALDTYSLAKYQHGVNYNLEQILVKTNLKGMSSECNDYHKMLTAKTDNIETYRDMATEFGITIPTAPNYEETFLKKYPILVAIDRYAGHNVADAIKQYIRLIEGK